MPNPISKRMRVAKRIYAKLRRQFLAQNPECAVYRNKPANQIHHRRGRIGTLLIDQRFWLSVSMAGHEWIGRNPVQARAKGFICEQGKWNTPPDDEVTRRLKELLA